MVGIIDYGMGNIHSVQKALEYMGATTIITNNPKDIERCKKLVLPGVGAFADAVMELKRRDLITAINSFIENKKIFLGICVGMQLLFEESQEAQNTSGLRLLSGVVKKFPDKKGLKVPQMGWNQLKIVSECQSVRVSSKCSLLKDIPDNSYVYFCHSYYPQPEDAKIIAAVCNYGIDFAAVVWKDNLYGVQFHPEKSQEIGLKILKNFIDL